MLLKPGTFIACMRSDGDGGETIDLKTASSTINNSLDTASWQENQTTFANPGEHYWKAHQVTRLVKVSISILE